jgi:hypothetical protein
MVRFLIVEPTHPGLNHRFDIGVTYLWLIILSVIGNVPINSDVFLITDFVNLKIKLTQYFEGAHRGKVYLHVYMHVFIGECSYVYEYLYICISKKYPHVHTHTTHATLLICIIHAF